VADGPRLEHFFVCSSCSCSFSFSIRFVFEFWLDEVSDSPRQRRRQSAGTRTVRDHPVDSPFFQGSLLEVLLDFFGQSAAQAGQSAVRVRTVCRIWPDNLRGPCGQSAPPRRTVRQCLAALLFGLFPLSFLLCFHMCFKESFLRLEVHP
jgi:hypothetical protein